MLTARTISSSTYPRMDLYVAIYFNSIDKFILFTCTWYYVLFKSIDMFILSTCTQFYVASYFKSIDKFICLHVLSFTWLFTLSQLISSVICGYLLKSIDKFILFT